MARVHTFRVLDRDYPYLLRDLSHPPDPVLVHGELLPAPAVAIVGTRTPSDEALTYAHRLAFRLARRGVTVWSGGAVGIDAAAHVGALDAGGRTIAVVPTGLDHCYPTKHAALYAEIVVAGGALVSPFERAREAARPNFFQRNAVLAAGWPENVPGAADWRHWIAIIEVAAGEPRAHDADIIPGQPVDHGVHGRPDAARDR